MANSREEQLRNNRRLARQITGAIVLVLVIIGLFTVLNWMVAAVRAALDDSDRRAMYEDRVYGLVMFDVPPFSDVSQVDETVFRQAAIWGTVYTAQSNGTLNDYERDEQTGSLILPQLEIDTYLTNLLGPDYQLTEGSFETEEFVYTYDEARQGYLVPVTGAVGLYTPEVERIWNEGGHTYVTVGYIPTLNNNTSGELSLTAPTEPTKYMDFVFTRGENRQWYLSALQESEMQPETAATATPAPSTGVEDSQAIVENSLSTAAPTEIPGETVSEESSETTAPPEETAPPEQDAESTAPEDAGEPQPEE